MPGRGRSHHAPACAHEIEMPRHALLHPEPAHHRIRADSLLVEEDAGSVDDALHLAAIALGNRVHALGAVTGVILEDGPAGRTAAELMGEREILHAELD